MLGRDRPCSVMFVTSSLAWLSTEIKWSEVKIYIAGSRLTKTVNNLAGTAMRGARANPRPRASSHSRARREIRTVTIQSPRGGPTQNDCRDGRWRPRGDTRTLLGKDSPPQRPRHNRSGIATDFSPSSPRSNFRAIFARRPPTLTQFGLIWFRTMLG